MPKTPSNDHLAWARIRREMFEQVLAQVKDRLGPETAELRAYRASYEKDVARRWALSTRDELLDAMAAHRLILFADFHALQQSQKTHRRLLDGLRERKAGPFVLALECVPAKNQKDLDRYLAGALSEKDFLRRVRWSDWGFPWEHYEPLFRWARKTRTPVLAADSRSAKLGARDRFAAKILARALKEHPDRRVVAIFGDLHLAADRLPRELAKAGAGTPVFRVFQNAEPVALALLKRDLDHRTDVIRYDARSFAVQNVPPWVKWQNYLLWLENKIDHELDGDESPDLTDPVAHMARWIAKELGAEVDAGALTVYTAADRDLWTRVRGSVAASERVWIEMMIEDGRSFYLSQPGWGYLARPSVNHAASLAAQFVHDRLSGGAKLGFKLPRDFQKMIWIETVAFFGSKIVNPKRKSDTLADIRNSLSSRQGDDRGREALRLALSQKMSEMMSSGGGPAPGTEVRPRAKSSWIAAAHLLGALLGERMYHGYRRRLLSRATARAMLAKPFDHRSFPLIYQELVEIIESLPAPFRSKREKL